MNKGAFFGSLTLGILTGVTAGIFIGMKIRQKRANEEVESVKTSFRKYFKAQIEDEKSNDNQEKESSDEKAKEKTEQAHAETPKHSSVESPYVILTKEEMLEALNETESSVESIIVTDTGHQMYVSDDVLTSKVGMTPEDIVETLRSGSVDSIYVKNNITDKFYEIYFGDY